MNIAVANWSARRVGGCEVYLDAFISSARERGHSICLVHEVDGPMDREPLTSLGVALTLNGSSLGQSHCLHQLREWQPELLYIHGLLDPAFERSLLREGPSVAFIHGYAGLCVSGTRTHMFPRPTPCSRRFGPACLALFHARRCGGLSPITLWKDYLRQQERLRLFASHQALVTHSNHLKQLLLEHGIPGERIHRLPFGLPNTPTAPPQPPGSTIAPIKILFVGRFDRHKGCRILVQAVAATASTLDRDLELVMAGDGPDREPTLALGEQLTRVHPRFRLRAPGWLGPRELETLWATCTLLAVPSLWPEPYGLVGIEAARRGVPVIAFDSGGIRDWLTNGSNGLLAPSNPPTADGFAARLQEALEQPDLLQRLRNGALESHRPTAWENHLDALLNLFQSIVRTGTHVNPGGRP